MPEAISISDDEEYLTHPGHAYRKTKERRKKNRPPGRGHPSTHLGPGSWTVGEEVESKGRITGSRSQNSMTGQPEGQGRR